MELQITQTYHKTSLSHHKHCASKVQGKIASGSSSGSDWFHARTWRCGFRTSTHVLNLYSIPRNETFKNQFEQRQVQIESRGDPSTRQNNFINFVGVRGLTLWPHLWIHGSKTHHCKNLYLQETRRWGCRKRPGPPVLPFWASGAQVVTGCCCSFKIQQGHTVYRLQKMQTNHAKNNLNIATPMCMRNSKIEWADENCFTAI